MEFVQFHPTGMVWPPSVRGILVTEAVRGDGGVLRNSEGKRFMFDYIPEFFTAETADTEEEADRWYDDKKNNRRPPELLPRDEVARAINSEVKAGRGIPHGGVFLDIASPPRAEYIKRRLPSMYHQFKELADVDITKEPMEVGPTCHYVMGGVEVDADTGATHRARAVRRRRGRRRHARRPTGSAATRCPTCWCSAGAPGRTPPSTPAQLGAAPAGGRPTTQVTAAAARRSRRSSGRGRREPVHDPARPAGRRCSELVGIIRTEAELERGARARSSALKERARGRDRRGAPPVQPGLAPGARPAQHADRVASASPGPRSSARRAAAATPATTTPAPTPELGQGQRSCIAEPATSTMPPVSRASRCPSCPTSSEQLVRAAQR